MAPLMRRLPRELKNNIGRYLGIFILITVAIGITTGYLAASANMRDLVDGTRDAYTVEDFRFATAEPASGAALRAVEGLGATVSDLSSVEVDMSVAGADRDVTLRAYRVRKDADIAAYDEGAAPAQADEIALDRTFAAHAGVHVGSEVEVAGRALTVSGIMTLPDYQAQFESNSDFVMDTLTFCVAEVSDAGFAALEASGGAKTADTYAVVLDDRSMPYKERADFEADAARVLAEHGETVTDLLDHESNKGISYAGRDLEGDAAMWYVMLMLIIAIMGFVFAVLTASTIDAESATIGALLASGYRKRELIAHYLALPALVGVSGAALGNILGYTLLSGPMRDIYYGAYSFPPYVSAFRPEVLLKTTVPPLALLVGTTLAGLAWRMRATPLMFLRGERPGRRRSGGAALPDALPFTTRFHLRVIARNLPHFAVLFCGIAFASVLLMFGLCLMPVIENYAESSRETLVARHQYTLKEPVALASDAGGTAERFCSGSLTLPRALGDSDETLPVYGIDEASLYWKCMDVSGGRVLLGSGAARKCGVRAGQTVAFGARYGDETYRVTVTAVVGEPADMGVYMSRGRFCELFGLDEGWFNGYVSNIALNLPDSAVASDLTPSAMDKIVAQMRETMGGLTGMLLVLAVVIYLVIVYLLTKTVIDRAARAIAYLKVFGYREREVDRLYLWPITAVVLMSLVLSIPVLLWMLDQLMFAAFSDMDGVFPRVVPPCSLVAEVGVGVVAYAAVAVLHVRRIRRVPMAEALKVTE